MRASRVVTVLAASALIGLVPAAGTAATDTSPPLLTAPPFAKFVVGSQIPTSTWTSAQQKITWKASDPESGITGVRVFDVQNYYWVVERSLVYIGVGNTITVTGWDKCDGSEGVYDLYHEVVAENGAGLTSAVQVGTKVTGWDQDGTWCNQYRGPDVQQSTGWSTSNFSGWFGGTTTKTTQKGAWTSYTIDGYELSQGRHVAVVMAKGPDRGKADIYLDGKLIKTVNTYSATKRHRVIVFDKAVTTTGTHTLRIVNKATAGHPRIDIDAILVNDITPS